MRYEFDDSESVVEFPLNFCPSETNGFIKRDISCPSELVNGQCTDQCINQCTGKDFCITALI